MQIEDRIQRYVVENLWYSNSGYKYDNNASFLNEGIIDSAGVMELATYVSTEFGFPVELHEITPENFDSVSKLATYIRRKLGAGKEQTKTT